MSKIYTSADQLVGSTPLLELSHIEKEYALGAKLYAKLEYFNPAGSVKDRIAKSMIDDAEKSGKLKLSHKALLPKPEGYVEEEKPARGPRREGPRGDSHSRPPRREGHNDDRRQGGNNRRH